MRLVCLSDTHNCNEAIDVPAGDVLVHAGDATVNGTGPEIAAFSEWFAALPHPVKIFVAGNHDLMFENDPSRARALLHPSIVYLQDSAAEVAGLRFYGSPWQPRFFDWAFNLDRGPQLAAKWAMIPEETDVLITHGPPHGMLDRVPREDGFSDEGCEELRRRVDEIAGHSRLRLHVFGHIHCGHGTAGSGGVRFVNASVCDEEYNPTQPPIVIDL